MFSRVYRRCLFHSAVDARSGHICVGIPHEWKPCVGRRYGGPYGDLGSAKFILSLNTQPCKLRGRSKFPRGRSPRPRGNSPCRRKKSSSFLRALRRLDLFLFSFRGVLAQAKLTSLQETLTSGNYLGFPDKTFCENFVEQWLQVYNEIVLKCDKLTIKFLKNGKTENSPNKLREGTKH